RARPARTSAYPILLPRTDQLKIPLHVVAVPRRNAFFRQHLLDHRGVVGVDLLVLAGGEAALRRAEDGLRLRRAGALLAVDARVLPLRRQPGLVAENIGIVLVADALAVALRHRRPLARLARF